MDLPFCSDALDGWCGAHILVRMSQSSGGKECWNHRYSQEGRLPPPDPWLVHAGPILAPGVPGPILDLACGLGQNALWLAALGLSVVGVDASAVAIERARYEARRRRVNATFEVTKVRAGEPFSRSWSGLWGAIIVFRFLDRTLFAQLERSVAPGGILAYNTHLQHPLRSLENGPRRPEHLLHSGELLWRLPAVTPLSYAEWAEGGRAFAAFLARRPRDHSS
jgi:tellurite methyltransferase